MYFKVIALIFFEDWLGMVYFVFHSLTIQILFNYLSLKFLGFTVCNGRYYVFETYVSPAIIISNYSSTTEQKYKKLSQSVQLQTWRKSISRVFFFHFGWYDILSTENWPILNILLKKFISAYPINSLNRISLIFDCIMDKGADLHIY